MIIRKPYAFLIKNFKKIHVVLLLLSFFILYKVVDISNFVKEYMTYGIYDAYLNPITKHITFWISLSLFVLIVGTGALIILLRYKKKPWKVYLVPLIEYLALFFILKMIKSFFVGYTYDVEVTDLKMSRDLLFIIQIFQLPAIGVFVMRVFGLDINKFNFNSDKEFFELSEKDREEIEISLSVDRNSFIRLYKKLIRNLGYIYEEHKRICNVIASILIIVIVANAFKFIFVTNRVYTQGHNYKTNGYTFKVNKSYFTDKDLSGNVISTESNFVIVDLTVTNNSAPRTLYMENFHLRNSSYDFVTTRQTFAREFSDLGNTYSSVKEFKRDETANFIIVYKVNKKLKKDRFVLYYQEKNGNLRKIKLKVKNLSTVDDSSELKLGDDLNVEIDGEVSETFSFDSADIVSEASYYIEGSKYTITTDDSYRILELNFGSDTYVSKNMIDFLKRYGKLIYKDSSDTEREVEIKSAISRQNDGKVVLLKVPSDMEYSKNYWFEFTIRNKGYIYKLA